MLQRHCESPDSSSALLQWRREVEVEEKARGGQCSSPQRWPTLLTSAAFNRYLSETEEEGRAAGWITTQQLNISRVLSCACLSPQPRHI